jgi:DNA-directed RNA polymerase subunit RPC12/RpoP
MSKYLETKKGSLEDMVAGVTEGKQSEDYKQLFKKELEKTGKGIGSMSDMEKKAFFNNIDKKHKAKNEDSKKVQKMNVKKSSGETIVKESVELDEGGVKDFLMDVEDDAGSMSLNDLIKKYYGQMGLTAQEIKKIYYRVNESVNEESEEKEEVKSLRDTVHDIWNQAAQDEEKREDDAKWLKTEEKKSITEEKIKCPNCGHMNDADAHKCSNCGASLNSKSEDKDGKKKAMTGSPATKVDTTPEVEYDK